MAHFAKLGANSKVIQVLTMDNDKMLNADGGAGGSGVVIIRYKYQQLI